MLTVSNQILTRHHIERGQSFNFVYCSSQVEDSKQMRKFVYLFLGFILNIGTQLGAVSGVLASIWISQFLLD
jgi:hypothetical protein